LDPRVVQPIAPSAGDAPAKPAKPAEPFCFYCGYNLHGVRAGANCPECGRVVVDAPRLVDADPQWLARLGKAANALLLLFTMPIMLVQSATTYLTPAGGRPATPVVLQAWMPLVSLLFAAAHLRGALILSGDVWVEGADESSHRRRSMLVLLSVMTVAATGLMSVGLLIGDRLIVAAGAFLTISAAPCLWLDLHFIRAIALRIPDVELARDARRLAMPVALVMGAVLAAFATVVTVGRSVFGIWTAIVLFIPLIAVLWRSSKVTKAFAARAAQFAMAAKARSGKPPS
jgi:hypothetical protein